MKKRILPDTGRLIAAAAASFILSSMVMLYFFNVDFYKVEAPASANMTLFLLVFAVAFVLLVSLTGLLSADWLIPDMLVLLTLTFSVMLVCEYSKQIMFNVGLVLVNFFVLRWAGIDDKMHLSRIRLSKRVCFILTVFLFLLFVFVVSYYSIVRFRGYRSSTFDFGIFAQMFNYLKTEGVPYTTVERNTLLSHFAVHFSPIYYLLLPFYCIYPHPETLLVLQALAVASGVFAVYKIAHVLECSPKLTLAFTAIYLLFPSMSTGCLYDFHENKFLPVLILWTMYFVLKGKTVGLFVFASLTLTVKEDAAIYILAIALYMLLCRKEKLKGLILFALAGIYFVVAVKAVDLFGGDVMTSRLRNYWAEGAETTGFAAVIKTCLLDIGYLISQVFTTEKLTFVLWMLLPVMFTPLLGKKLGIAVLLLPMLVINLMPNYVYQYDVNYQYTFGPAALIVVAAVLVIYKMKPGTRNTVLTCSLSVCIIFTASLFIPKAESFYNLYKESREETEAVTLMLEKLPEDADILSNTYIIPHLYDRKDVYMFPNRHGDNDKKCTYALVDTRFEQDDFYEFLDGEYTKIDSAYFCEVYVRNEEPNA